MVVSKNKMKIGLALGGGSARGWAHIGVPVSYTHLPPEVTEIRSVMLAHLHDLYAFYGELTGMRMARKHISWYTKGLKDSANFRHSMNTLQTIDLQLSAIDAFFNHLQTRDHRLQYDEQDESNQSEFEINNLALKVA